MTNSAIRHHRRARCRPFRCDRRGRFSCTSARRPVYDEKFLDYLDKKGVPYKNKIEIIRVAKQFCLDTSRQGGSTWKAGYRLTQDQGWTQSQAENFIQAAIPTYCPGLWG